MKTIHRLTAYCLSLALCLMLVAQSSHAIQSSHAVGYQVGLVNQSGEHSLEARKHVGALEDETAPGSPGEHHAGDKIASNSTGPCHGRMMAHGQVRGHGQMTGNECQMETGCRCHTAIVLFSGMRASDLELAEVAPAPMDTPLVHVEEFSPFVQLARLPKAPPLFSVSPYKYHFSRTMRQLS